MFPWNVPTFYAGLESPDHLLLLPFPSRTSQTGLWQPCRVLGQSQTSAFWAGNWRCSTLHNLCLKVRITGFLKPGTAVLLGHCSHTNLSHQNIFGFISVSILLSKSCSVTTKFTKSSAFCFLSQRYGISHDVYFHGININVMCYLPNVSQLIKYLNSFCKNAFCLLLRRYTHLCIIICRLFSTPEHRRILLLFKIPLRSNGFYTYMLISLW